jgi:hypothetical protein
MLMLTIILQFVPQIYVSVVAQGFLQETFHVLIQGALLTKRNVNGILERLKEQIRKVENGAANVFGRLDFFSSPLIFSHLLLSFSPLFFTTPPLSLFHLFFFPFPYH